MTHAHSRPEPCANESHGLRVPCIRNRQCCDAVSSCDAAQPLAGTFSLQNLCVRYGTAGTARPEFVSRDGHCATIWAYSEFSGRFGRVSRLQAGLDGWDLPRCQQRRLGLGVRYSSDNLGHQLRFAAAVPAALQRHSASDAWLVPIGSKFPHERPGKLFEFTLRGLSNATSEQLRFDTEALLNSPCTCFRLFVAFTGGFDPRAARVYAVRRKRRSGR